MAHGSNLQGVETLATFEEGTDEFVLNSPTISSTKMWIGALGVWATHAIIVARIIIKAKDYGNHLFMEHVRDLSTHAVLPSIETLDMGVKSLECLVCVDNGVRLANLSISIYGSLR